MTVLVLSNQRIIREALCEAFKADGLPVIGADTLDGAASAAERLPNGGPHALLVDARHPNGRSLVLLLRKQEPRVHVLVLTAHESEDEFLDWADLGISGYAGPHVGCGEVVAAVRDIESGHVLCPPQFAGLLLRHVADARNPKRAIGGRVRLSLLTEREREIASLLALGLSNKEIARRSCRSLPTIKNHVHSLLEKWNVRSRGEAAAHYRDLIMLDRSMAQPSPPERTPLRLVRSNPMRA